MKNQNIFISLGIVIYIVMSGIDKFVYRLPNMVYIPIAILGIILILIGFLKIKKRQSLTNVSKKMLFKDNKI